MEKKIPTLFTAVPQGEFKQITPLISKGRVSIFYKYENRNRAYITDEFAEKLISSLPYVPVVGIYDDEKEDFTSHSRDRNAARIYGLVPENPNGEWVQKIDNDGVVRTYYVVDVYLYTGRLENANKIIGNPQSLELDVNSIQGSWTLMGGQDYFVYTAGHFIGLSALGKDVEPCFEGAAFFDLLTQFGEFCLQTREKQIDNINKNTDAGGIEQMDLANFKFKKKRKTDSIWKSINPNYSKDNELTIDKVVCAISEDYAIAYNEKENTYEKFSISTNDEGVAVVDSNAQAVFSVWIDELEKENLNALQNQYSNFAEIVSAIENFNKTISEQETKISEKDGKILELEKEKTTYSLEVETVKGELEQLKSNYAALKEKCEAQENKEKESKIAEYEDMLSDSALAGIKEKMADFNMEELEKELLFTMKKEKPTMFSKEQTPMAPSSFVSDNGANGLVSILKKYTN